MPRRRERRGERGSHAQRPVAAARRALRALPRSPDPLAHVPAEVEHAERTAVGREGPDLVGAHLLVVLGVRRVEVGVAGVQDVAVREEPPVGAARGALPLALGAEARAGDAPAREPRERTPRASSHAIPATGKRSQS